MTRYMFTHLADAKLCAVLRSFLAHAERSEALLLAYLAEFDARRLYLPAAYPSMYAYCLHELRMSEDIASKRIRVARAAREFPALFPAIAQGFVHLSGVMLLTPHLMAANAERILALARHRTCDEIRLLLAREFPSPDLATGIEPLGAAEPDTRTPNTVDSAGFSPASKRVEFLENSQVHAPIPAQSLEPQHATKHVPATALAPEGAVASPSRPAVSFAAPARDRVAPLAPQRYGLQVTLPQTTHDKLRRAQELLGHSVASGDIAQVLDRALDALIAQLERKRFAATDAPRLPRGASDSRHISAHVRREVWKRDGGRCTFTGPDGRRCASRRDLEYDHVKPVARGGDSTTNNLRLRCRGHNQLAANHALGLPLMDAKRAAGRDRAAANRESRETAAAEQARTHAVAEEAIPWLREMRERSSASGSESALRTAAPADHSDSP